MPDSVTPHWPRAARAWFILAALCLAANQAVQAQAPSSTEVSRAATTASEQLALSISLLARKLAEMQAAWSAAWQKKQDCLLGGSAFVTSACAVSPSDAELEAQKNAWKTAEAEQREREATLAALRRVASSLPAAQSVADILAGKGGSLGFLPGLDAFKATIDQSVVVDRGTTTVRFRTGRLAHCFSLRSVCNARPYAEGR